MRIAPTAAPPHPDMTTLDLTGCLGVTLKCCNADSWIGNAEYCNICQRQIFRLPAAMANTSLQKISIFQT